VIEDNKSCMLQVLIRDFPLIQRAVLEIIDKVANIVLCDLLTDSWYLV